MLHELTEPHGLEVERVGTGLGLAQLEQLIDHDAKVCDLGNQELDGCPQAFGELERAAVRSRPLSLPTS